MTIGNSTARIRNNFALLINGYDTELPFRNRDIKASQISQFATIIEAFGLTIIWVPFDEIITIKIEPIYANRVKGLCGTFNWNKKVNFEFFWVLTKI